MKLTLLQFITLCFVSGWVGGQVVKGDYWTCLYLALSTALIGAYLNDAHKLLWTSIVRLYHRLS